MKQIIFGLFLISALSCNKDPNSATTTTASIEYKVNGTAVSMDNVDITSGKYVVFQKQLAGTVIPKTRYLLNAQNGANNVVVFYIVADSLQKINYRLDSTFVATALNYNGQVSALLHKDDYISVNITDYSGSKISGTFTGKLSPVSGTAGSTLITEGKINNVQVIY